MKRKGIINTVDEHVLEKGTKVYLKSRTTNDKTEDEVPLQSAEEGETRF